MQNNGGLRASLWRPPTRPSPQVQPGSGPPPILVIGLGNPILGDDGVGWLVAEQVRQALEDGDLHGKAIEIDCLASVG